MKDARSVLDDVRGKVSPTDKLLVVWFEGNNVLRCTQTNMNTKDIRQVADSLLADAIRAELVKVK